MVLTPRFELHVFNAWLLCIPLLLNGLYIAAFRRDAAKRMSDMTGYSAREKQATIIASLMPYPVMILTIWSPFTTVTPLLMAGLAVYAAGLLVLADALFVFYTTPPDQPFTSGAYKLSRHPIYVAAVLIFLGISLATASLLLLAILLALLVPQHFMILAEERICREKYAQYGAYARRVSRYLPGI